MISTDRNVSRYYKTLGRDKIQGTLLEKCFENHINNQCENLLNEADIYGIHFKGDGATIKNKPLLNILSGGVHLIPASV